MANQESDEICSEFVAHFWKKHICKNCFRKEEDHVIDKSADSKDEGHRLYDIQQDTTNIATTVRFTSRNVDHKGIPLLPLKSAVKELEDHGVISNISHKASMAEELCQNPSDGLTVDESAAIHLFTMEWQPKDESLHARLNAALRSNDPNKLKYFLPYHKLFLTALSKLPSVTMTVWRGINVDLSNEYSVGKVFTWPGFSSCTTTLNVLQSKEFLANAKTKTIFKIQCHSGKDIRTHSHFPEENEILLLPATQFRVVRKLTPNPTECIIHATETSASEICRTKNSELSNFIRFNRTVRRICFSGLILNNEDARFVIEELKMNVDWERVFLNDIHFDVQITQCLADALVINFKMKILSLDCTKLNDEAIAYLTKSLHSNRILTDLRLDSNGITNTGAFSIASMLCINQSLQKLYLNKNLINDEGMIAICKALKNNKVLRELSMDSNQVTDKSVESIVMLIEQSGTLELIDLRNNPISEEGRLTIEMVTERLDRILYEFLYEMEKLPLEKDHLEKEISNLLNQLFQTTAARISLELDIQSLEEEISFVTQVHAAKIEMLKEASLLPIDVTQFYRTELTRCMADIKNDFEALAQAQTRELNEYYTIKLEETKEKINTIEIPNVDDTVKQSYAELYVSVHDSIAEIYNLTNECNIKSENIATLQSNLENLKHKNNDKIDCLEYEIHDLQFQIEQISNLKLKVNSENAGLQLVLKTYERLIKVN